VTYLDSRAAFSLLRGTTSATTTTENYIFAYEKVQAIGVPRHWRTALLKDARGAGRPLVSAA